jgi:hypothetical protein
LVYEMFHHKKEISRDVYDYCLREKIADEKLIAKWKKVRANVGVERDVSLHRVDMNDCVVCIAYPRKITPTERCAFVECRAPNWSLASSLNACSVDAAVAHLAIDYINDGRLLVKQERGFFHCTSLTRARARGRI